MRIEFNRTGAERKVLVKAISEITGAAAVYKFMPTCAYEIDYFTITKDGALEFDDRADSEEIETLLEQLAERGFTAADSTEKETAEEVSEDAAAEPQGESVGLTVAIPLDKVAVGNLTKLLDAKGSLIKKALGITDLPIEITEDAVSFPWFSLSPDLDSAKAYTDFIAALCRMSKEQKRINATEKEVTNEKYAFRCFLLRLGFIGAEYKAARKILLKNLTGSSAFKTAKEAADDEISE
ncbi:virulence protein [Falcatimonas sp. MSJ-15]|uniref:virulence protein n=1 Tax=Falcatimonas sp. MSJ-15 TaxID=2841515 RepID=UPI001C120AEE|nr:virulence protein [Falcatimonas sp. MSJ-15]MBU5471568.1 virulence protein [Falcatimonas sp. MSJ-15]